MAATVAMVVGVGEGTLSTNICFPSGAAGGTAYNSFAVEDEANTLIWSCTGAGREFKRMFLSVWFLSVWLPVCGGLARHGSS